MQNRSPPQPNLERARQTEELMRNSETDIDRWREFNNLATQWDERAAMAAELIGENQRVLDIGAGAMALELLLANNCTYIPADVVERRPGCQVVDLNKHEFPRGEYDCITLLGVLEYIHDITWPLKAALRSTPKLIVTYCCNTGADLADRRGLGWVNDYSKIEFEEVLTSIGWKIDSCNFVKRGSTNIQYMYSCVPRQRSISTTQVPIKEVLKALRAQGLTFCGRPGKLETLVAVLQRIEQRQIPGILIEAGVAMGGSAIVTARSKMQTRPLHLYDVFEMLPPPGQGDDSHAQKTYEKFLNGEVMGITSQNYVKHANHLQDFIIQNMQQFQIDPETEHIYFHRGLFKDTLVIDEMVAFAHIDCDWHDSVVTCIERIAPHIAIGGVMLFDDYNSFTGCRKAVDNWLSTDKRFKVIHQEWTLAVKRAV